MLCNGKEHHLLSLKVSQWKLGQQHNQECPKEGKATAEQLGSQETNQTKSAGLQQLKSGIYVES